MLQLSSLLGSLILAVGYGYEVKGVNDQKVNNAEIFIQLASKIALPGAMLVNYLPFREYSFCKRKYSTFIRINQYDTSPNGFRGLAISRSLAMATI